MNIKITRKNIKVIKMKKETYNIKGQIVKCYNFKILEKNSKFDKKKSDVYDIILKYS